MIAQVLEALMMVTFGLSWPINAYKNYQAGTAAGTSWQFIGLITLGYIVGIAAKFVSGQINWVLAVYFLNLACLTINWAVYFRNTRLDRERIDGEKRAETAAAAAAVTAVTATPSEVAAASTQAAQTACAPQLQRVVIASDGSQSSLKAATFAAEALNLGRGGAVKVLSIAADDSQVSHERADSAIAATSKVLGDKGITCTGDVRVGVPAAQIIDAAVDNDTQIIVMGSRGLSGLKELVLGSVSRAVVDKAACPVLVIK